MTTDGVDERPAPNVHGAAAIPWTQPAVTRRIGDSLQARIPALEARAERAERALLKTWYDGAFDRCNACGVYCKPGVGQEIEHTPDCIIPDLERRYGIANTTPDAGT